MQRDNSYILAVTCVILWLGGLLAVVAALHIKPQQNGAGQRDNAYNPSESNQGARGQIDTAPKSIKSAIEQDGGNRNEKSSNGQNQNLNSGNATPDSNAEVAEATRELVNVTRVSAALQLLAIIAAIITALAAYGSANAAKRAVNLASDTAKRQLRAYVGAQHMAPYVLEPGKHPIAKIVIKNFGLTPASDIQAVGIIAMGGSSYEWFLKNRPALGAPANSPRWHIEPGDHHIGYIENIKVTVSSDDLDNIKGGRNALWLVGEIRYGDAFGDYWTKHFRCFLTGKDGVLSNEFVLAPEGNGETKATLASSVILKSSGEIVAG